MSNWKILVYQGKAYPNYEINSHGKVRIAATQKVMKTFKRESGRGSNIWFEAVHIGLGKRGSHKCVIIHRAVAETFIPNPSLLPFVLFRDGNSANVDADNLYWCKNKSGFDTQPKVRKNTGAAVSKRRRKVKELAIEYKGGQCQICGYKKCVAALEFHHRTPGEKDFAISRCSTKAWETTRKELDKCILVCSNCHREIHSGLIALDDKGC